MVLGTWEGRFLWGDVSNLRYLGEGGVAWVGGVLDVMIPVCSYSLLARAFQVLSNHQSIVPLRQFQFLGGLTEFSRTALPYQVLCYAVTRNGTRNADSCHYRNSI